jgi:SAM-dependent methyltransferase
LFTPKPGRTLIVGSRVYNGKEDRRKRYPDAIGVDMQAGDGVDEVFDLATDNHDTGLIGYWWECFTHVECMSVLEHCRQPWLMAKNIENVLEPGGTIFVTVPFVWRVHGYPDDYWRFTISGVKALFSQIEWEHEAYSHRDLSPDIPAIRSADDWPYFARTEVCMFGRKRA